MRLKLLLLFVSAGFLQACENKVDNCTVKEGQEATNTEATAMQTTDMAPVVTTEPIATNSGKNMKARSATKSSENYVNVESKNTPGFKASYPVHRSIYKNENTNAQKRVNNSNRNTSTQSIAYERVQSQRGNIRVTYDEPGDDYRGKDVQSHDGVDKNVERNINYLDNAASKVPNDGGEFK